MAESNSRANFDNLIAIDVPLAEAASGSAHAGNLQRRLTSFATGSDWFKQG